LAFSRKQVMQPRVVDPANVVRELVPMLRRLIGEDVVLQLGLDLETSTIRVDTSQLQQVIVNLVVNARDAMPRGGTLTLETCNVEFDGSYVAEYNGEPVAKFRGTPPYKGFSGNIGAMACYAGQSVGEVRGVQPAAEIVAEVAGAAEKLLRSSAVSA
jgi:hypothetical protein